MSCNSPLEVKDAKGNKLRVPCKQCLQCRIMKHSHLKTKLALEFIRSYSAQFITFTYDETSLPETLDYNDISKPLRRLQERRRRKGLPSIQYLSVGEYGEKYRRPHWHIMMFNHDPYPEGRSHIELWPHGFAHIGTVTTASIGYIGQYSLKFNFNEQDKPIAAWSKKPALGQSGIEYIVDYMVENDIPPTQEFNMLNLQGRKYFLCPTLMNKAQERFEMHGWKLPRRNGIIEEEKRLIDLKLGISEAKELPHQEMKEFMDETRQLRGTL